MHFVSESGGKVICQMTWADVIWRHVVATDDKWDFFRSESTFFNPLSLIPVGTLYSIMGHDTVGIQTPWLACSNPFNYWGPAGDSIYSKDYVLTTVNRYKNTTKYWEVAKEI